MGRSHDSDEDDHDDGEDVDEDDNYDKNDDDNRAHVSCKRGRDPSWILTIARVREVAT